MPLQRPTKTRRAAAPPKDPERMSDDELTALLEKAGDDLANVELSYEDAVRYLRRLKLVCRGPRVGAALSAEKAQAAITKSLRAGDHAAAARTDAAHRGVINRSTGELEPCGYDFVDMIVETKHPLDGSLLTYQCPKCGVQGEMRPAYLNVTDRPNAKVHAALREKFLTKANALHESRKHVTKRAE